MGSAQFEKIKKKVGEQLKKIPYDNVARKIKVNHMTIRYEGLFDFDSMYAAVSDWAKNYGYLWREKGYKHKMPGGVAEKDFDWIMNKSVTDFVKYEIKIKIATWNHTESMVEVNGRQVPLSNGKIQFEISSTLMFDWQGKFSGSPFKEFFGKVYWKLMQEELLAIYWDQLYYRTWNLHAMIKQYFDMQTKHNAYKDILGEN